MRIIENTNDIEQCVQRYSDMLFRLCFMIVKNEQDTQDILQETFIAYMNYKKHFESEEHKKAWLIKVSQNKCKDFLRFHKRHQHVPLQSVEEILDLYQAASPADRIDFDFLWNLDTKYRTVILLHYVEGYSIEEVASIMNISLAAARKRLQRARIQLKENRNSNINGGKAYE